jgi:hypothetical protein
MIVPVTSPSSEEIDDTSASGGGSLASTFRAFLIDDSGAGSSKSRFRASTFMVQALRC